MNIVQLRMTSCAVLGVS